MINATGLTIHDHHPSEGQRPRPSHRAPVTALRLTRRGRIIRDMVTGAAVLGAAVFAQPVSVAFFTAVVWAGQASGLSA